MTVANILDIFSSTLPSDSGSDCSDCRLDGSGLVRLRDFEYNHVESLDEFVVPDIGAWRTAIPMKGIPLNIALVDDANVSPMPIMSFLYDQALSPAHECKVSELWGMIKTRGSIRKFTPSDVETVKLAIRVAYVAFWGRKTFRSLEILINRAKGTAAVLGELRAEPDVVVAGLLHDIFSDVTSDEIMTEMKERLIHLFGKDVIALVESYTRLPNFMARKTHYTHIQSENQIQMLVASAEDYRALYIRIADRLHSMRVLRTLPLDPEERIKIAQEARNVYASLAHKMGLIKFKGELEDLALSILEPNMFKLSKQIQLKAVKAFYQGAEEIQETLDNDPYLNSQNVKYNYKKRVKDKYQIVMKMLRKGLQDMNELKDILGVRIIVDCPRFPAETDQEYTQRTIDVCYHVVSVVERLSGWQPRGFKDFIKNSKTNGYASLHLFMWNLAYKTFCEVQVRTRQMHMQAELGEAAHFYYKDRMYRPEIANSKYYRVAWRSSEQVVAKTAAGDN
jgi:guanosine-3',5'-bis(diphosphate) 3'-pyrophosphohydrolase